MSLSRKVWGLTLALTIGLTTICAAAPSYPYGAFQYGQKNITVKGDLSYSGLSGIQTRPSIAYRHDINAHNAISGVWSPSSGYLKTVQFDIQPLPGVEPTDAFKDKSGYHLVPVEEELIKDLATKANGNAQFVWSTVNTLSHPIVKQYFVNGMPYVNIGSIFYLSGGGDPDMQSASRDGVSSPLFQTTYKTTPWPSIPVFEQKANGDLHIKGLAHSIYDTAITGTITVNGQSKQLFKKTDGVSNYTVLNENSIPLSTLPGIKEGENTATLTVTDAFGRTATKSLTVKLVPNSSGACQPVLLKAKDVEFPIHWRRLSGTTSISVGGPVSWMVRYNSFDCSVLESTVKHHVGNLKAPMKHNDQQANYMMNAWDFMVSESKQGIEFENKSTDSQPLVVQLVESSSKKVIKQYSINKGTKLEIPLPTKDYRGKYILVFPSPLTVQGFWTNQTQTKSGYKASYTIPDILKTPTESMQKFLGQ